MQSNPKPNVIDALQVVDPLPPMHAISVRNVSSFWPAEAHTNESLCPVTMPANRSARDLRCGYPQWHPFQITGEQSTSNYGDSSYAWCPASRTGNGGYSEGGDDYLKFSFDPSLSFRQNGYTEFIEVTFATAVYAQSVEIGEPSGMGSIVRIKALHAPTGGWFTMWEAPDGEGDPRVQYRGRVRNEYRSFKPLPVCSTTFKTDTIRLEMDTRTVTDWNELDYVQLVGALSLPRGALPYGTREVVYVPDPDAFGEDVFTYSLSDCAFDLRRQSSPVTTATVSIAAVNDAPVAANYTISDLESQPGESSKVVRVDLATLATDVDGDELSYHIDQLWGDVTARLENSVLIVESAGEQEFGLRYAATDPSMAWSHGFIAFLPKCSNGIIDGARCVPCPAGTHAADDLDGRVECRPCNPSQFQPEEGQYGCISCDSLGDGFYQELRGQTSCQDCPAHTQRYIGVLDGASRSACQCKAGVQSECSLGPLD